MSSFEKTGAIRQGNRGIVYEDSAPADAVAVYELLYVLYEAALSRPCVSCNGAELAGMERELGEMFRLPGFAVSRENGQRFKFHLRKPP